MHVRLWASVLALLFMVHPAPLHGQNKRDQQVRQDHSAYGEDEHWNYGNLAQAFRIAGNEQKPLMVVFRCIP